MRTRGMQVRGIQRHTSDVTDDRVACRVLGETDHAVESDSTGEKVINQSWNGIDGVPAAETIARGGGRHDRTGRAENLTVR
jgi:hypothetical protein